MCATLAAWCGLGERGGPAEEEAVTPSRPGVRLFIQRTRRKNLIISTRIITKNSLRPARSAVIMLGARSFRRPAAAAVFSWPLLRGRTQGRAFVPSTSTPTLGAPKGAAVRARDSQVSGERNPGVHLLALCRADFRRPLPLTDIVFNTAWHCFLVLCVPRAPHAGPLGCVSGSWACWVPAYVMSSLLAMHLDDQTANRVTKSRL